VYFENVPILKNEERVVGRTNNFKFENIHNAILACTYYMN